MNPVNPLPTEHQAFHMHLDICARCRNRPFDLCSIGALLLRLAAASCLPDPPRAQETK